MTGEPQFAAGLFFRPTFRTSTPVGVVFTSLVGLIDDHSRLPAMRQKYRDVAGPVGRRSRYDVLHLGMRGVAVDVCLPYQAHDGGSALACAW